jgi:hypothetical protein
MGGGNLILTDTMVNLAGHPPSSALTEVEASPLRSHLNTVNRATGYDTRDQQPEHPK